jgi:polyhydroxyalkanoate synthesis regulator phasin
MTPVPAMTGLMQPARKGPDAGPRSGAADRKTSMRMNLAVAGLCLALAAGTVRAQAAADDVTLLRNTVANLLEALVKQGLLTPDAASRLVTDAQAKATAEATESGEAPAPGDVRVTYVPEVVREQIAAEVQAAVGEAVVADVKNQARAEGWGIPAALPDWVRRVRWAGELRMRAESTVFDDGNSTTIPDYQRINQQGTTADLGQEQFLNTEDQLRLQVRLTLGALYELTPNFLGALSLTTGNSLNPVTRNQSFGLYGRSLPVLLDEAYFKYQTPVERENHHVKALFGRFASPWQATDLVWYVDTRFNGAALQYGSNSLSVQEARGLFGTLGVFQLQEEAFTANDKWLFGAQGGYEWQFGDRVKGSVAAAWYQYENITGEQNPEDSRIFDYTAPGFVQKGNTLFNIRSFSDDPQAELWALAAEYQILHLNTTWAWLVTPNLQADFVGEWVRNLGYDEDDVSERVGRFVAERTTAYRLQWRLGNPNIARPWAWRFTAGYNYSERDALLDAFTDTNFRRGGTDAEGIILASELGVTNNSWLRLRYLGADEIDGLAYGVDVIQLDFHGQF